MARGRPGLIGVLKAFSLEFTLFEVKYGNQFTLYFYLGLGFCLSQYLYAASKAQTSYWHRGWGKYRNATGHESSFEFC